ncbi:MAG: type II toxin-antitoxin system RelE/ParE family toxin [Desulfobulbaceae bacterium]|nr:type II toxin-antitoxin system RelE/ParE family toxin [Desulfobulbaceae bacterium]
MTWEVKFDPKADRELDRLDPQYARRILSFLSKKIATDEDPKRYGKPLHGNLAGLWKYRIENYRIICDIQDEKIVVLVLRAGHRSKVYGGH